MAVKKFKAGGTLTVSVRIVHGLISTYGHIVVLQASGLAEALREMGCSVDLVSGFFLPQGSTHSVDLTVFTFELLSMRGNRHWPSVRQSMAAWSEKSALTVGLVQDDFTRSAETERLVESGIVDFLLSPHAFDHDRISFLYPKLSQENVKFARNGYLDRQVLNAFEDGWKALGRRKDRPVFGRARSLDGRFGSLGDHKSHALVELRTELELREIMCDIDTSGQGRLRGFAWYERIKASRAVVNPVGGSGLIDRHGLRNWITNKPRLASLFSAGGFDSTINSRGVPLPSFGPRVLEALALGTPQILTNIPGLIQRVFPGLAPWRHFIPLGPQLENLTEVADSLKDAAMLESISREGKAYVDAHPEFFFPHLAEQVVALIDSGSQEHRPQHSKKNEEPFPGNYLPNPTETTLLHKALMRLGLNVPVSANERRYTDAIELEKERLSPVSEHLARGLESLARQLESGEMTPLGAHFLPILYPNSVLVRHDIGKIMEA